MTEWRTAMSWRDELEAIIGVVPADQLADLIGELARLDVLARQRLARDNGAAPSSPPEKYLKAREVAVMLEMSKQWVYAHQRELGGTRLDGAVRFGERAVRRYLAARKA